MEFTEAIHAIAGFGSLLLLVIILSKGRSQKEKQKKQAYKELRGY